MTRPFTLLSGAILAIILVTAAACLAPPTDACGAACQPPPPPPQASCGATIPLIAPDSEWPNAPLGFTVASDEPFNTLGGDGWQVAQRRTINGSGVSLARDTTAPASPDNVLRFTYGVGFPAGYEPGLAFFDLPTPTKGAYFGFWWKPSNPWQNNEVSGVNKIAFLLTAQTAIHGGMVIMMFSTGGPYTLQVQPEFPNDTRRLEPNVVTTPIVLGAWHRIEWFVQFSSDSASRNGVTAWWLDGVLQGRYTDLQMPADGFREYQLAPTWGGVVGTKSETDFFCYDHAFLSHS